MCPEKLLWVMKSPKYRTKKAHDKQGTKHFVQVQIAIPDSKRMSEDKLEHVLQDILQDIQSKCLEDIFKISSLEQQVLADRQDIFKIS